MAEQLKYGDTTGRYNGDFRIKDIFLYNYAGAKLDISNITAVINLYQDLDSAFISGNILISDEAAVASKFPIIGNEFLEFKARTPINQVGGDEEIDASTHRFQIYKKTALRTAQNSQAIGLFFASVEASRNERVRVSKTMSGNYHDMIEKIVKDKQYLNSKKILFVDETRGQYKITFPNKRPVDAINMIKSMSEPRDYETPHYLFYENNRGIFFRSFESLYRESADTRRNRPFTAYIDLLSAYAPEFGTTADAVTDVAVKPYSFSFDQSYDTMLNTRKGMFASRQYSHDAYNKTWSKSDFSYSIYYDKALHIDAPEGYQKYQGVMPPGPAEFDDIYDTADKSKGSLSKTQVGRLHDSDISTAKKADDRNFFDDYPSRTLVTSDTKYNHSTGTTSFNTNGLSFDPLTDHKRVMSSNLRDYFSMTMDVPGNFRYNVGDLVWCEVPNYNAAESDTQSAVMREDKVDLLLTGRYIIKGLHHQIDIVDQKHTTVLKVCRNTFASKIPGAEYFASKAEIKVNTIDVIPNAVSLSTGLTTKLAKELKIPTSQTTTVEDVAKRLNLDLNTSDLNAKDAANKAVNAVLNSTTNRVLQNKYLAQVNDIVANRQSALKKIITKTNMQFGGINLPKSINLDSIKSSIKGGLSNITNSKFAQMAKVNFANFGKSVRSFFRR